MPVRPERIYDEIGATVVTMPGLPVGSGFCGATGAQNSRRPRDLLTAQAAR
jgi:hypothetical protein